MRIKFFLYHIALIVVLMCSLNSCATYALKVAQDAEGWEQAVPPSEDELEHRVYLIGDAGLSKPQKPSQALAMLETHLKDAPKESTLLFLGDNVPQQGLAPKSYPKQRARDEYSLGQQIELAKDFDGAVYFLPGERDWAHHSVQGLKRQEDFLEEALDKKDALLPHPGCSGPEEIEVSDHLSIFILDTEWWLADWSDHPNINEDEDCIAKSREVFNHFYHEDIKKNRTKNVLIAMHHPPYTYGPHGGATTLRQHLFPLTDLQKSLYIPLPLVGTMYQLIRRNVGARQDRSHPNYRALSANLINTAANYGQYIFAAAHDHTLQHIEMHDQTVIVSGAGSHREPVKLGKGSRMAYGGQGFAQLDFFQSGSAWVTYWATDEDNADGKGRIIYRQQIKGPLKAIVEEQVVEQKDFPALPKKITRPLSNYDFSRGAVGRFFWGDHYRSTYALKLEVPTLDLTTFQGGVTPVKRGGGAQTNSLRLQTNDKRDYTMRSVDKDATRTLPLQYSNSFVENIVRDNFSSAHPLSALAIPKMAEAVGISYARPELYYVPQQPALESYNSDFGEALYLVEERADEDVWADYDNFGNAKDILSTPKMLEEVHDDYENRVDQKMVVRARLFDLILGDWDRHDDQWRWGEHKEGDVVWYRPIPRDRDQAFSNFDGFLLGLARRTIPFARQLKVYTGTISTPIQWNSYNARRFDRSFLTELTEEDWLEQARYLQQHLTDEAIDAGFSDWPDEVYKLEGPRLAAIVKQRRDNLLPAASAWYKYLARKVEIVGKNQRDLFVVQRGKDQTRVRVFNTNKQREREVLYYDRIFHHNETQYINLYGLEDEDIFEISGEGDQGILIRIIGGADEDTIRDVSRVGAMSRRTQYYDILSDDNYIEANAGELSDRRSNHPKYNLYNRRSTDYEPDFSIFGPIIGYNVDDGIQFGLTYLHTAYGFKKDPFAHQQTITGLYSMTTNGAQLRYVGEWIDKIGRWDLRLQASLQTPFYTSNFYGLGNNTFNPEDLPGLNVAYNRVRQQVVTIYPALSHRFQKKSYISIGPHFQSIKVERTPGRFIDDIGDQFDPEIFQGVEFFGFKGIFHYENINNSAAPTRGIAFHAESGYSYVPELEDKSFGFVDANLDFYEALDRYAKLVFATEIGVQHRFSDDFPFYMSANLNGTGQDGNFRGLRRGRFRGKTAFWQNMDLRFNIFKSHNKAVPFTGGLFAGFDHGRVWMPGEDSNFWHYSYGGGLWLSPFDIISLNVSAFRGSTHDQWRLIVAGKFFF